MEDHKHPLDPRPLVLLDQVSRARLCLVFSFDSILTFPFCFSGPQSPIQGVPLNITLKSSLGRPPMRNSVEGLNQEIERLVLKELDDRVGAILLQFAFASGFSET